MADKDIAGQGFGQAGAAKIAEIDPLLRKIVEPRADKIPDFRPERPAMDENQSHAAALGA
jgi:hypothetical protein